MAYTDNTIPIRKPRDVRPPRRNRRRLLPRHPRRIALIVLGLALLLAVLAYLPVADLATAITVADARPAVPATSPLFGANVLVVGVDARPGFAAEGVRGDSLIVVRLDPAGRALRLLSIPRDSLIVLPEFGETKIGAAYGLGFADPVGRYGPGTPPGAAGQALAAEAVEQLIGLRIHYTVSLNFDGFAAIIDALGGVTIDVPQRIVDETYPTPDFGIMTVVFEPGVQTMDGARALIYARTRHADSDFARGDRQQQVFRAALAVLRARGPLGTPGLVRDLRAALPGAISTTLPFARPDALLALAWIGSGLEPQAVGRFALSPETVTLTETGSDLRWDPAEVRELVQRFLAGDADVTAAPRVQVFNGAGIAGLAREATLAIEAAGFVVLPPADAPEQQRTTVYDVAGNPRAARQLATQLRADLQRGPPPAEIASTAEIVVVLGAGQ